MANSANTQKNADENAKASLSAYNVSPAIKRLIANKQKFSWRGVSYEAAKLTKAQLDTLANDPKYKDISPSSKK